jgi:hypothetical protein
VVRAEPVRAPSIEPTLSELAEAAGRRAEPQPTDGDALPSASYAEIKNGDVVFDTTAGSLGLPAAVEPPVKCERKRRAVR